MGTLLLATEKPFSKDAVRLIRLALDGSGHRLEILESYKTQIELMNAIAHVDGLIFRSDIINETILTAAKQLKIAVRAGAGFDNIDCNAARNKNIVVMNTPGQNANAVAELAFGMMIYQYRRQFDGSTGLELRGKNLGLIGYGNIGRFMAQIGKGFGMPVYAYKRTPDPVSMRIDGVLPAQSFEEIFETCSFVSLHVPAVKDTIGAIDYNLLKRLPKNGMLVNTARQEVVNEDDLIKVMKERMDISYVGDFMPKNFALFNEQFAKRWYAPLKKIGAQTEEANTNAGVAAAQQIINYLNKGDDTFRVN